jgi:predicted nucleic acid-binding protein
VKFALVDTLYFVALFNPRDQWHDRAIAAGERIKSHRLISTEDVLVELLNFLSEYGERTRRGAVEQVENVLSGASIEIVPQSHESFADGFSLY